MYSLTDSLSWNLLQQQFIAQDTEQHIVIIHVMFCLQALLLFCQCIIVYCTN